jgi:ubiquinol-cytochrome c reductase iron-sulfur subunit
VKRRLIMGSLVASVIAGVGLTVAYVLAASNVMQGTLLAIALAGIGVAVVVWSFTLSGGETEEVRHPLATDDGIDDDLQVRESPEAPSRRTFIGLMAAAITSLVVALAAPFRSLDPGSGPELFHTKWSAGARLVDIDGNPVRVGDVDIGSVVTVFPEGYAGDGQSQSLLLHVDPAVYTPPTGREDWAPEGHVVFSKICTHAGCPIGLYEAADQLLLCPCHQSTFEVLDGARPVFGPAPRPLPQLPITITQDRWLAAQSDFLEPVGPGFWNRDR